MSDSYSNLINNNNVDPHATFTLSEEQQEALYQQFAIRYQAEHPSQDSSRKNEAIELPNEIWDELKSSSRNELHNNAKRFIRDTQRYIAGDWTKTPVINRPFVADLRRFQVEAKQVITSRYEDSDKLKIVGRSAAEIFEGLNAFTESGDEETFLQIMEKRSEGAHSRSPQTATTCTTLGRSTCRRRKQNNGLLSRRCRKDPPSQI
ncbi:hypothetical protein G6F51_013338 [Rhizopus arrhizus]|uniref:Uncharacterized protein n=1 Tax=Rhizopus oryzae TaxID=64495 RepID=A0A9P6XSY7_RHIOR|nr:hypothetical protein G6F51_013338 [Rhizopus arrhizus]